MKLSRVRSASVPTRNRLSGIVSVLLLLSLTVLLPSCKSKTPAADDTSTPFRRPPRPHLYLRFRKEKWITEVTDAFNRAGNKTSTGKRIYVRAFPMGSGEAIDEVMEGRRQPDIISPASSAFIKLGNANPKVKPARISLLAPTI